MRYTRCAGSVGIIYFINSNWPMRNALYICRARAGSIGLVIIHIGIIDDGGIMDNIYHPAMRLVIVVNTRAVHITLRRANPVIIGYMVSTSK